VSFRAPPTPSDGIPRRQGPPCDDREHGRRCHSPHSGATSRQVSGPGGTCAQPGFRHSSASPPPSTTELNLCVTPARGGPLGVATQRRRARYAQRDVLPPESRSTTPRSSRVRSVHVLGPGAHRPDRIAAAYSPRTPRADGVARGYRAGEIRPHARSRVQACRLAGDGGRGFAVRSGRALRVQPRAAAKSSHLHAPGEPTTVARGPRELANHFFATTSASRSRVEASFGSVVRLHPSGPLRVPLPVDAGLSGDYPRSNLTIAAQRAPPGRRGSGAGRRANGRMMRHS
jgi:hypothetical protein